MGVNISLQFLLSAVGLASAGLVLNRNWLKSFINLEVDHDTDQGVISVPSQTIITAPSLLNYSATAPAITWFDAWLELGMTFYIGFAAVWIMSLFIACLSFRYIRPILVIPNIVILILGVLLNGIAFGAILAKNLNMSSGSLLASDYQQVILLYIMALFILIFLCTFLFIYLSVRYYYFMLKRLDRLSNPSPKKIVQTTTIPSPVSTAVEYSKTQQKPQSP